MTADALLTCRRCCGTYCSWRSSSGLQDPHSERRRSDPLRRSRAERKESSGLRRGVRSRWTHFGRLQLVPVRDDVVLNAIASSVEEDRTDEQDDDDDVREGRREVDDLEVS